MVTQTEHDEATQRTLDIQKSGRYIVAAHYDAPSQTIHVTFKSGFTFSFPKERCQVTANATDEELSETEISPAGSSVDFPRIDDGLTAEGILAGRLGSAKWEEAWATSHRDAVAA